jgi:hypothetical protein
MPGFSTAMQSIIARGWVHQNLRHRDAYSLSDSGYKATRRVAV